MPLCLCQNNSSWIGFCEKKVVVWNVTIKRRSTLDIFILMDINITGKQLVAYTCTLIIKVGISIGLQFSCYSTIKLWLSINNLSTQFISGYEFLYVFLPSVFGCGCCNRVTGSCDSNESDLQPRQLQEYLSQEEELSQLPARESEFSQKIQYLVKI